MACASSPTGLLSWWTSPRTWNSYPQNSWNHMKQHVKDFLTLRLWVKTSWNNWKRLLEQVLFFLGECYVVIRVFGVRLFPHVTSKFGPFAWDTQTFEVQLEENKRGLWRHRWKLVQWSTFDPRASTDNKLQNLLGSQWTMQTADVSFNQKQLCQMHEHVKGCLSYQITVILDDFGV